jgi:hypothetical protein
MNTSVRKKNVFSLGAEIGGSDAAGATRLEQQQLRDAMNQWSGDYCRDIREFAFLLRIDGAIHSYTRQWNIHGAQKARRKKDWVEVEIGIPEDWWRQNKSGHFKKHLAEEIEKGLHSMVELLQRNRHAVRAEALLADWGRIKERYLA